MPRNTKKRRASGAFTLTALVSAYYSPDFIQGRIENLLKQKPKPEIVVVGKKGSKEIEVATEFQKQGAKIIIAETEGIPTIYEAWNLGIEVSTGDYLFNANTDDRHYPGALKSQVEILQKNPKYAVAYYDFDVVRELGGKPIGQFRWGEGGIEALLKGCFVSPSPMWRRSLHDKYGLFDAEMHSAGDYEFWLRIAKSGELFYHIKQVRGAYLQREGQLEHREPLRTLWEQARAKARYREGVGIWVTPAPMSES